MAFIESKATHIHTNSLLFNILLTRVKFMKYDNYIYIETEKKINKNFMN